MAVAQIIFEDLVVYIWQHQLFEHANLTTKSGKKLAVTYPGVRQFDSGPDFSNASVIIDKLKLAGNIEIHFQEADWEKHNHHKDKAYNSVILHVVWQSKNISTKLNNGADVEILQLSDFVDARLIEHYKVLMQNSDVIPCKQFSPAINQITFIQFLTKIAIERLERKVNDIDALRLRFNNDWNQILFVYLARYLGGKLNNDALQHLAENTPVRVLYKNLHSLKSIEAILFGQSGLLERNIDDEYFNKLKIEYNYQNRLHSLSGIDAVSLKFSKIRPAAFPSFRIAQLSAIIASGNFSFDKILACETVAEFENSFMMTNHSYWESHFDFNQNQQKKHAFKIGKATLQMLSINVLVPILFTYGKYLQEEMYCDKAIVFLESISKESNGIIRDFEFLNYKPTNAMESQALIQLKTAYCDRHQCLSCYVGKTVLKS